MKPISFVVIFVVTLLSGPVDAAVMQDDFKVSATANLLNLCSASPDDPRYREALHFCHGYLVGAFHYYRAQETDSGGSKFLCIPEPKPTRNATIQRFVAWAQEHPEYANELPVDTEFRFLLEIWPCGQGVQ